MKNVDYVYILLLTIIAALLLMLVMKPDPQPVKPRVYSEVQCDLEINNLLNQGHVIFGDKRRGKKAISEMESKMKQRIQDGWVMLPYSGNGALNCYAR